MHRHQACIAEHTQSATDKPTHTDTQSQNFKTLNIYIMIRLLYGYNVHIIYRMGWKVVQTLNAMPNTCNEHGDIKCVIIIIE